MSWKNPRPDTGGHYTWDDYLDKGPLAALSVVRSITRVNGMEEWMEWKEMEGRNGGMVEWKWNGMEWI